VSIAVLSGCSGTESTITEAITGILHQLRMMMMLVVVVVVVVVVVDDDGGGGGGG
jgi:hypothetical protein